MLGSNGDFFNLAPRPRIHVHVFFLAFVDRHRMADYDSRYLCNPYPGGRIGQASHEQISQHLRVFRLEHIGPPSNV
jgi:hypothetical protein